MINFGTALRTGAAVLAICGAAEASPVNGTGDVTPNAIFGSGNSNGSFTGQTQNNIEVGLRAKQRYPKANVFNYDGVDTYTFDSTVLNTNPPDRSVFNFEWSVNVDKSGTSALVLSDYSYLLSFDIDNTLSTNFVSFDPFNSASYYDHALGTNSTPNGGGTTSGNLAALIVNMGLYNVAQQSSNLGFGFSADPDLSRYLRFHVPSFQQRHAGVVVICKYPRRGQPGPFAGGPPIVGERLGCDGADWCKTEKAESRGAGGVVELPPAEFADPRPPIGDIGRLAGLGTACLPVSHHKSRGRDGPPRAARRCCRLSEVVDPRGLT